MMGRNIRFNGYFRAFSLLVYFSAVGVLKTSFRCCEVEIAVQREQGVEKFKDDITFWYSYLLLTFLGALMVKSLKINSCFSKTAQVTRFFSFNRSVGNHVQIFLEIFLLQSVGKGSMLPNTHSLFSHQ